MASVLNKVASRVLPQAAKDLKLLLKKPELLRESILINGQWTASDSNKTFSVDNPATGLSLSQVSDGTVSDLKKAIAAADDAFVSFKKINNRERASMLRKWAQLLNENIDDLALILTAENGKPLAEAKGELASCAVNFDWFADEAPRIYGDVIPSQRSDCRIHTIKQPIGVCGIITPWNFPASMISRKVGAAVAAGCTTVIKPPSETPLSALAMAYLGELAGIPKGVVNVVPTFSHTKEFGKEICESPIVKKVTFTGSTNVGKVLMSQAASTVKKVSFELGGNAPFIVFGDADVNAAVQGAVSSKFRGSGQTCICANRFYVHKSIYNEFSEKFAAAVSELKVGDGTISGVNQGPLINSKAVDKVSSHVKDALSRNGKVLTGGKQLEELGSNFYAPTVIVDATPEFLVCREETFGPLAVLIPFETDEEVINLANNVEVGLGGYFFTRDVTRANLVAEALEVGMVGVNTGLISEAALPFGGVKESGFGREGSKYGLDDYMVLKSVITQL